MPVTVPPEETAWLLHHVVGFDALDPGDTAAILVEATRFAEGVLAPLERDGDRIGAKLVDGRVITPPGFKEAFQAYAEGGWIGTAAPEESGGQGLPDVLALAAFEPVSSANMGFGLCPMLTQDAIQLLATHGSADQKERLLAPLVAGSWTGTMCLTEPQAGSDLGAVRSKAEPDGNGLYRITGQKIFITYGEHDWTANILHMVLARLPDAPAGSAGISLFAVPKFLPDGSRNPVRCVSIEHKLGIHASPTCVLAFEDALGEIVGPPHRGLPSMFSMMNAARLGVAMQGVAVAERAFRRAAEFATTREQSGGPIVIHPDVRRTLWTMRALALGGRLLTLYAAEQQHRDPVRAALLIPVAKSWASDAGVEAASLGVQVHGGMGYIEETGAAQHLRDSRITPIYEGTNGIQALTLLRRGLLRDQGAALGALLDEIVAAEGVTPALREAAEATRSAAAWLRQAEPRAAEAGATPFLNLVGTLAAGWLCARTLARPDAPVAARTAASVFLDQVLPRTMAFGAATVTPSAGLTGTELVA
ncbi:3-methylmercaptopropionyl-CoA dehydrogenase [Rhodovastum atsumiense]|uniref:Acyl-CoA dehydrogenase n=1 Tax=Rhodovastum atsumiense TaxID=504468 RepID=A0A5M6ILJ9_9PROT|nr:acyl-CoA dehydrogenase family protein [Rhodovastum atsumiense]KAA5608495.1 acyl-CoA dehydrogenase [Rhodovastum atsumiense]CAH2599288.1 3-methylmercaptopropionyl-CoA dehydrogenase [Rhodovastum atsumiense]